ncbi:MAG: AAA family ATPase [Phycisphaera sp.]|nr:AAA family ATPase [Phycisphaera sp.]
MSDDKTLRSLRDALKFSPNNLPLRKHIAEILTQLRRYDEAETEYRDALKLAPNDLDMKLALAHCFYEQSKNSEALVIVEDLVRKMEAPAEAELLYARLMLRAGEFDMARARYKRAVDLDPELADADMAEDLGVSVEPWREQDEQVRVHAETPDDGPSVEIERPKLTFDSVGGMDKVKEDIRMKIINPMIHPEIYKAYGKTIGGGILMYGPPGCGKTHLARATAGEVHAGFMSVGISDVLDMWLGNSERNLRELFQTARRTQPCVMFFDEVDALGASRTDMRQSGGRHLINQFLSELDGVEHSNEGVLILAATNAPWHLDSAFRRPGRFDRIVFIPPPDASARADILRVMLTGKPTDRVDHEQIARKTDGFSGADLKAVVDLAVEAKLREAMSKGIPSPLVTKDLLASAKQVKPSTKEWFSTARNYALYSNQGGIYDDILDYLKMR